MNFADSMRNAANTTLTENGAHAYKSTGNAVLDLFGRIGGLRRASDLEIEQAYLRARDEDKELADNMILYARNIREGGLGERRVSRIMLRTLAMKDPAKVLRNLDTIVNAGRYDDLFALEGTPVESEMLEFIRAQFRQDVLDMANGKNISLLAKWLPSCNTHSKETRRLARKVYTFFGISESTYRKTLSALRKHLDVVEKKMSAREFDEINYGAVPSVAMTRYRSAFGRHDFERFDQYIKAVNEGKEKINASVSYPYELIRPYVTKFGGWSCPHLTEDPVLEAQWKALPNYVEGNHNVIVMSDLSGSMTTDNWKPMATSISLGIYFAERNTGAYQNLLMTFSNDPQFIELNSKRSLAGKCSDIMNPNYVGYNTNLDKALAAIYTKAVRCGDAPTALVVISDGEIDLYCRNNNVGDIVTRWQEKYAKAGLVAPKLILWNVESRGQKYLGKANNPGVAFISGSSASTFKELTTLISMDAVAAMVAILTKPQFCWR